MSGVFRKVFNLGVCVTVVLLSAGAVFAASEDTLVNVYASGQPVQNVLYKLAKDAGVEIRVDAAVKGDVDLSLKAVKLKSALNVICQITGAEWEHSLKPGETEVYIVRLKRSQNSDSKQNDLIKPEAGNPSFSEPSDNNKQKLDFRALAGGVSDVSSTPAPEKDEKTAKTNSAEAPPREIKLNKAQMQLVLQGVPNYRVNNVLSRWRQQNSGGPKFYIPGPVQGPIFPQPYQIQTPYGPYWTAPPPDVRYYYPDGSVWRGYPFPYQKINGSNTFPKK